MSRRNIISVLLLFVFVITIVIVTMGSSKKEQLIFEGQGETWSGSYVQTKLSDGDYRYVMKFETIDKVENLEWDPSSPIEIRAKIGTRDSGGKIPLEMFTQTKGKASFTVSGNGKEVYSDTEINYFFKWDDNEEEIKLLKQ